MATNGAVLRATCFGNEIIKDKGLTMLVLTRKEGETIVLKGTSGDERPIRITIGRLNSSSVRVAIDAPVDVDVLRGELLTGEKG